MEHRHQSVPQIGKSDPLLRKANRLTAVAKAMGELDLKAIAASYQRKVGSNGFEASAAATAALDAALRSSLGEGSMEAAEREVKRIARPHARDHLTATWREAQAKEQGAEGHARREEARSVIEAKAARALEAKAKRLQEEAALRRTDREARLGLAAGNKAIADARARCSSLTTQKRTTPLGEDLASTSSFAAAPAEVLNDPTLKRARSLCRDVARVIADLEQQNQHLRSKIGQ